jgi:hypothetical protein
MVAEKIARVCDDFVSKVGHTETVIHVFAAALVVVSGSSGSGLYGKVVISPARPVCTAGESCTAPDRNDMLTFWRGGRRVAIARTNAAGSYRVALAPGRYVVKVKRPRGIGRGLEPVRATVPRGRYARVNFTLDIGIR